MSTLSFNQVPQYCARLCQAGRLSDAFAVVNAFLDQGAPHFQALEQVIVADDSPAHGRRVDQLMGRLCRQFPDQPNTWLLEAKVRQWRHQWPDLLAALDRCEDLGVDAGQLALLRANARERLLEPERALEHLSQCGPGTGTPGDWQRIRALALMQLHREGEAIGELRAWLPGAAGNWMTVACWKILGKLLDRNGNREEAFDAFTEGNRLANRLYGLDPARNPLGVRIEAFREICTPEWRESWGADPDAPDASASPVFLIGFPRSGTTLLEQILDAHPGIVAMEEKPATDAVWDAFGRMARGRGGHHSGPVERQAAQLGALAELTAGELGHLRDLYAGAVSEWVAWSEDKLLVDKLPLNSTSLPLLARIFPRARFILALRHPADVLLSNYMQEFEMNPAMHYMVDLDRAAGLYRSVMALVRQCESALDIGEQLHYLRYEDLLEDFSGTVGRLLEFLGLPWDEAVTRYHEHARERGTLGTPSYQGVTQQLYRSARGRWLGYAEHLRPVFGQLREACERFGYDLEGALEAREDAAGG